MRQTVAGTAEGDGKQQLIGKCLDVFLTFRPPNRVIRHFTIEWIGIMEKRHRSELMWLLSLPPGATIGINHAVPMTRAARARSLSRRPDVRSPYPPLVVASAAIRGSCPHGIINSARSAPACAIAVRMSVSIRLSSTIPSETAYETLIAVARSRCSAGAPIVLVGPGSDSSCLKSGCVSSS